MEEVTVQRKWRLRAALARRAAARRPTTGLDPRSKREVQAFVRELRDSHDTTIVLTTHDMIEADELCDRIAIIHNGNIVALDTPAHLKKRVSDNGHVPTLEEVFLKMTGEQLVRDDQPE
jgi:ABC-2 type transport system ATP-binding protein